MTRLSLGRMTTIEFEYSTPAFFYLLANYPRSFRSILWNESIVRVYKSKRAGIGELPNNFSTVKRFDGHPTFSP